MKLRLIAWWRRRFARDQAGDYMTRIQPLRPETPLPLPPVKPLKAQKQIENRSKRSA